MPSLFLARSPIYTDASVRSTNDKEVSLKTLFISFNVVGVSSTVSFYEIYCLTLFTIFKENYSSTLVAMGSKVVLVLSYLPQSSSSPLGSHVAVNHQRPSFSGGCSKTRLEKSVAA